MYIPGSELRENKFNRLHTIVWLGYGIYCIIIIIIYITIDPEVREIQKHKILLNY